MNKKNRITNKKPFGPSSQKVISARPRFHPGEENVFEDEYGINSVQNNMSKC